MDMPRRAELNNTDGVVPIAAIGKVLAGLAPTQWAVVTSASRSLAEARIRTPTPPTPEP